MAKRIVLEVRRLCSDNRPIVGVPRAVNFLTAKRKSASIGNDIAEFFEMQRRMDEIMEEIMEARMSKILGDLVARNGERLAFFALTPEQRMERQAENIVSASMR